MWYRRVLEKKCATNVGSKMAPLLGFEQYGKYFQKVTLNLILRAGADLESLRPCTRHYELIRVWIHGYDMKVIKLQPKCSMG